MAGSSGDAAGLRVLSGQDVSRREIHPKGLVEGSWDRSDVEGYQAGWVRQGARARGEVVGEEEGDEEEEEEEEGRRTRIRGTRKRG